MKKTQRSFIGREEELQKLTLLLNKSTASLIVIKGRRRIGKSRLVQEFAKPLKKYIFSGLPPTAKTTRREQLNEFGWQLGKALGEPPFKDDDWNDLFLRLANRCQKGRILILFDEITWMGSKDPQFLGKLKNAWDLEFKNNPELMLILCGSISSWIEKNILCSTGFLGRISLNLTLEELPLSDCSKFWAFTGGKVAPYEKLKILSITGGVPKYLEEIQPRLSAEANIKNLCFDKSGLLFHEFDQIFSDLFSKRNEIYKKIIWALVEGPAFRRDICKKLDIPSNGLMGEYLDDLVQAGFLVHYPTWHLDSGKISKLGRYRIKDNYLRFYLKHIAPNKERIARGFFAKKPLTSLPSWTSIMGLQFENLVLNNRERLWEILEIKPEEIVFENPFFQRKTTRRVGCQIDYMIQTTFSTLYVCEIKFSKNLVGSDIFEEIEKKIKRLQMPKHMSFRPVLIQVNGVSEEVEESEYFYKIVNFSELLEER